MMRTGHVVGLPLENEAKATLERIRKEFLPIVERRGYNVTILTEMCCCGDGADHFDNIGNGYGNGKSSGNVSNSNRNVSRGLSGGKKGGTRRTKTKTMPDNVLGYNLTIGGGRKRLRKGPPQKSSSIHQIHLRLRHPRSHSPVPYEDVVGTMAHELAHCEHSRHDTAFYRLMDEIQNQHEVWLKKGLVVDGEGFPMNSDRAYVLGGGGVGGGRRALNGRTVRRDRNYDKQNEVEKEECRRIQRHRAAQQRMDHSRVIGGTYVLGGTTKEPVKARNGSGKNDRDRNTLSRQSPGDAVRMAAERRWAETRALLDSDHCLPCHEIIEILDDSDDENDSDDHNSSHHVQDKNGSEIRDQVVQSKDNNMIVVDLTDSPSVKHTKTEPETKAKAESWKWSSPTRSHGWSCPQCTLWNSSNDCKISSSQISPPSPLKRCKACDFQRRTTPTPTSEVRVGEQQGGRSSFDVYKSATFGTGTMYHLT